MPISPARKFARDGLTRAMSSLMTRIYRASDRITVITESFAEAIAARGIDREKVVAIPNFVDTAAVMPLPRANSFRRQQGLDDRFVVMYAGNIGYTHGTELLVDAAAKLAAIPDLVFLVIGGGSKQADLVRLARERRSRQHAVSAHAIQRVAARNAGHRRRPRPDLEAGCGQDIVSRTHI